MGTNYYLQKLHPETGRARDVHICKMSGGWTPSMRGYRDGKNSWYQNSIQSWIEWKWYLLKETKQGGIIFNEYDEPISLKEFFRRVMEWQNATMLDGVPKSNHSVEARKGAFSEGEMDSHARACWIDDEGYSFHDGEFS